MLMRQHVATSIRSVLLLTALFSISFSQFINGPRRNPIDTIKTFRTIPRFPGNGARGNFQRSNLNYVQQNNLRFQQLDQRLLGRRDVDSDSNTGTTPAGENDQQPRFENSGFCRDGWSEASINGLAICIRVNKESASWEDAQENCRKDYSFLLKLEVPITVQSRSIQDHLLSLGIKNVWTGLHSEHDHLVWDDITPSLAQVQNGSKTPTFDWNKTFPSETNDVCGEIDIQDNSHAIETKRRRKKRAPENQPTFLNQFQNFFQQQPSTPNSKEVVDPFPTLDFNKLNIPNTFHSLNNNKKLIQFANMRKRLPFVNRNLENANLMKTMLLRNRMYLNSKNMNGNEYNSPPQSAGEQPANVRPVDNQKYFELLKMLRSGSNVIKDENAKTSDKNKENLPTQDSFSQMTTVARSDDEQRVLSDLEKIKQLGDLFSQPTINDKKTEDDDKKTKFDKLRELMTPIPPFDIETIQKLKSEDSKPTIATLFSNVDKNGDKDQNTPMGLLQKLGSVKIDKKDKLSSTIEQVFNVEKMQLELKDGKKKDTEDKKLELKPSDMLEMDKIPEIKDVDKLGSVVGLLNVGSTDKLDDGIINKKNDMKTEMAGITTVSGFNKMNSIFISSDISKDKAKSSISDDNSKSLTDISGIPSITSTGTPVGFGTPNIANTAIEEQDIDTVKLEDAITKGTGNDDLNLQIQKSKEDESKMDLKKSNIEPIFVHLPINNLDLSNRATKVSDIKNNNLTSDNEAENNMLFKLLEGIDTNVNINDDASIKHLKEQLEKKLIIEEDSTHKKITKNADAIPKNDDIKVLEPKNDEKVNLEPSSVGGLIIHGFQPEPEVAVQSQSNDDIPAKEEKTNIISDNLNGNNIGENLDGNVNNMLKILKSSEKKINDDITELSALGSSVLQQMMTNDPKGTSIGHIINSISTTPTDEKNEEDSIIKIVDNLDKTGLSVEEDKKNFQKMTNLDEGDKLDQTPGGITILRNLQDDVDTLKIEEGLVDAKEVSTDDITEAKVLAPITDISEPGDKTDAKVLNILKNDENIRDESVDETTLTKLISLDKKSDIDSFLVPGVSPEFNDADENIKATVEKSLPEIDLPVEDIKITVPIETLSESETSENDEEIPIITDLSDENVDKLINKTKTSENDEEIRFITDLSDENVDKLINKTNGKMLVLKDDQDAPLQPTVRDEILSAVVDSGEDSNDNVQGITTKDDILVTNVDTLSMNKSDAKSKVISDVETKIEDGDEASNEAVSVSNVTETESIGDLSNDIKDVPEIKELGENDNLNVIPSGISVYLGDDSFDDLSDSSKTVLSHDNSGTDDKVETGDEKSMSEVTNTTKIGVGDKRDDSEEIDTVDPPKLNVEKGLNLMEENDIADIDLADPIVETLDDQLDNIVGETTDPPGLIIEDETILSSKIDTIDSEDSLTQVNDTDAIEDVVDGFIDKVDDANIEVTSPVDDLKDAVEGIVIPDIFHNDNFDIINDAVDDSVVEDILDLDKKKADVDLAERNDHIDSGETKDDTHLDETKNDMDLGFTDDKINQDGPEIDEISEQEGNVINTIGNEHSEDNLWNTTDDISENNDIKYYNDLDSETLNDTFDVDNNNTSDDSDEIDKFKDDEHVSDEKENLNAFDVDVNEDENVGKEIISDEFTYDTDSDTSNDENMTVYLDSSSSEHITNYTDSSDSVENITDALDWNDEGSLVSEAAAQDDAVRQSEIRDLDTTRTADDLLEEEAEEFVPPEDIVERIPQSHENNGESAKDTKKLIMRLGGCENPKPSVCFSQPIKVDTDVSLCGQGWYGNVFVNKCYRYIPQAMTYQFANEMCIKEGGQLAIVDTNFMRRFILTSVTLARNSANMRNNEIDLWVHTNPGSPSCKLLVRSMVVQDVNCLALAEAVCERERQQTGTLIGDENADGHDFNYIHSEVKQFEMYDINNKLKCPLSNVAIELPIMWYKDGAPIASKVTHTSHSITLPLMTHVEVSQTSDLLINFDLTNALSSTVNNTMEMLQGRYWCEAWTLDPFKRKESKSTLVRFSDVMSFVGRIDIHPLDHFDHTLYNMIYQPTGAISKIMGDLKIIHENILPSLQSVVPEVEKIQIKPEIIDKNPQRLKFYTYATMTTPYTMVMERSVNLLIRRELRESLQNTSFLLSLPGRTPIHLIRSLQFFSTVACPMDKLKDSETSLIATFPSSATGLEVTSVETCDGEVAGRARCDGDFDTGAHWTDVRVFKTCNNDGDTNSEDSEDIPSSEETSDDDATVMGRISVQSRLKELAEVDVEDDNVDAVMDETAEILETAQELTAEYVDYVAEIVDKTAKVSHTTKVTGENIVKTVDKLLDIDDDEIKKTKKANSIIKSLEKVAENMALDVYGKFRIVTPNVALEVWDLKHQSLPVIGLAAKEDFLSNEFEENQIVTLYNRSQIYVDDVNAAIELPPELIHEVMTQSESRLYMMVYRHGRLFKTMDEAKTRLIDNKEAQFVDDSGLLNSFVISASIGGRQIQNLKNNVKAIFKPLKNVQGKEKTCAYWDFTLNNNRGGWSAKGCSYNGTENGRDICLCNHLTNFAVLIDFYGQSEPIPEDHEISLSIISLIGLSLSILGLSLTIISYAFFKKLRRGRAQQTLFNLALSMLCSWIVFLTGIKQTHSYYGCIIVAAMLHYFILSSFMWMLMEAFLQYLTFVKVLGTYVTRFTLKTVLIAWGLPLIPVISVLSIDYTLYAGGNRYCWMSLTAFYYSFAIPVGLIILCNMTVFIVTVVSICRRPHGLRSNQSKSKLAMANLQAAITSFVLLGLTWFLGYLAISDARLPFQYAFTILNSLQGFFIFVLFVLRKKRVRDQWLILCCCKNQEQEKALRSLSASGSIPSTGSGRSSYSGRSVRSDSTTTTNSYVNDSYDSLFLPFKSSRPSLYYREKSNSTSSG